MGGNPEGGMAPALGHVGARRAPLCLLSLSKGGWLPHRQHLIDLARLAATRSNRPHRAAFS